jgi:hypothetical protein
MEAMIRKQQIRTQQSNGKKRSAFRIRGRPVNPEKINRYIKEHLTCADDERKTDWNIGLAGIIPAAIILA